MESETVTFSIDAIKTAITTVLTSFTSNLTVANIAAILGIIITACLTLYLFYWGARKAIAMLKSSFESGDFHI